MLIPCGTEHCSIFCHSDPSLCFLLCRSSAPCWMEQLQPGLGAAVPPSCCSPLSIDPGHGLMSPSLDNSSQQHGPGNGCATEVCSLPGRANNRAPNLGDRNRSHPSGLSIPRSTSRQRMLPTQPHTEHCHTQPGSDLGRIPAAAPQSTATARRMHLPTSWGRSAEAAPLPFCFVLCSMHHPDPVQPQDEAGSPCSPGGRVPGHGAAGHRRLHLPGHARVTPDALEVPRSNFNFIVSQSFSGSS